MLCRDREVDSSSGWEGKGVGRKVEAKRNENGEEEGEEEEEQEEGEDWVKEVWWWGHLEAWDIWCAVGGADGALWALHGLSRCN